jgi:hypothetical protein
METNEKLLLYMNMGKSQIYVTNVPCKEVSMIFREAVFSVGVFI